MTIDEPQYDGHGDYPWHSWEDMNTPRVVIADVLPPEQEALLVAQAAQGNRVAFGRLYDAHFDSVYDIAARIEGNQPDAEALTDRAMSRHLTRVESGDQTVMQAPYLHVLLVDLAEEARRAISLRERVQRRLLQRVFPERYAAIIPDFWLHFDRDDRMIISLVYSGGMTPQEAADTLHCDVYYCMEVLDHARELASATSAEFPETE